MKLEDQVCSLDLAKKLKELGVKQDSYFYWVREFREEMPPFKLQSGRRPDSIEDCSAFTVGELGEMLPTKTRDSFQVMSVKDGGWYCVREEVRVSALANTRHVGQHRDEWANTEADARAKMLVYLIENNLLKVAQINQSES